MSQHVLMDDLDSLPATRWPITIPRELWGDQAVRVATWLVEIGENVLQGDVLVEVARPGIVGDVRAPLDGVVLEIRHLENEMVTAGDTLGWLELQSPEPRRVDRPN